MCLHPRKIVNQSKYIGFNNNQAFYINVPCGECAECMEAKKNEWLFRTYWQVQDTLNKGGYVLFDTLSYDDAHLPHVEDYFKRYNLKFWDYEDKKMKNFELGQNNFSCFSHEDYRYFLVRLRRKLEYHGFNPKENLKYFMSCEYGHDNVYRDSHGRLRKGTCRPHYHILFFVTDTSLSAMDLSRYIDECWQKGRTDGINYKPYAYVNNHVYGYNELVTNNKKVRAVCNYVAKYVNKDGDWKKLVENRIKKLFEIIYNDEFWKDDKLKDTYKKLVRDIDVFHRQSQGFGLYALEAQDEDEMKNMLNTGMMSMPDDYKGRHGMHIPMPTYYQHKLFWEWYRDSQGVLRMRRTQFGAEYGMQRLLSSIDMRVKKYREWYENIPLNMKFVETEQTYEDGDGNVIKMKINEDLVDPFNPLQTQVLNLLGDRSWRDYVIYKMVYEGRVRSRYSMRTGEVDDIRSVVYNRFFNNVIDDVYHIEKSKNFEGNEIIMDKKDVWFNYQTQVDKRHFGRRFIFNDFVGNKDLGYSPFYGKYDNNSECYTGKDISKCSGFMTPRVFEMLFCYNEKSNEKFKDFDKLSNLIDRFNEGYSKNKQSVYDKKEHTKKILKQVYGK